MKIIIVGAGFAGLSAAHKLHKSGAELIVLEAGSYNNYFLRRSYLPVRVDGHIQVPGHCGNRLPTAYRPRGQSCRAAFTAA